MKKAVSIVGVLLLCVTAALVALRIDHLWPEGRSVFGLREAQPTLRRASYEAVAQPIDFRAAVKHLMPSVVSVDKLQQVPRGFYSRDYEIAQTATGSGVIVSSEGHIVTNHHVVEAAYSVQVRLSDGRSYAAKVVGSDPISDIAVLKIEAKNLVPAELGDNTKLEPGEWVIALGNPLGFSNTVSVGVVSSLNRSLPSESGSVLVEGIQTDAAINQGNSGGALANAAGQVVGINSIIASNTGGSVGLGFAIPIRRVQRVVDDILKYGHAKYGTLGIRIFNRSGMLANDQVRRSLQETVGATPPPSGVIIRSVMPGGPAERAGFAELDVLLEIEGKKLEEPFDYVISLVNKRPGDKVRVSYWSKGERKSTTVALVES